MHYTRTEQIDTINLETVSSENILISISMFAVGHKDNYLKNIW